MSQGYSLLQFADIRRRKSKVGKKWYNFFVVSEGQEPAVSPEPSPVRPQAAKPRRVADIVPDAEAEPTFTAPVSNTSALQDIYRSAQIGSPAHGYTVLKVADMLQSEHIRTLPPDVKRKSIMVALDAAGVDVKEIVEDAVKRDRALDTYERVLQKHLEDFRSQKELENKRLEEEISQRVAELRAKIEQNQKELNAEQENLLSWRKTKHQEEEKIAEAVGYFVTENPITAASSSNKKGGADNVR